MDEDVCPICYENLNVTTNNTNTNLDPNDNITTLKCGHKFHSLCILETYKHNRDKTKNSYIKIRVCPFCRKDGGYLKLIRNVFPLKKIHKEWDIINEQINNKNNNLEDFLLPYLNKDKCYALLKTGINKGSQCSKKKYGDSNYCHIHCKKFNSYN